MLRSHKLKLQVITSINCGNSNTNELEILRTIFLALEHSETLSCEIHNSSRPLLSEVSLDYSNCLLRKKSMIKIHIYFILVNSWNKTEHFACPDVIKMGGTFKCTIFSIFTQTATLPLMSNCSHVSFLNLKHADIGNFFQWIFFSYRWYTCSTSCYVLFWVEF